MIYFLPLGEHSTFLNLYYYLLLINILQGAKCLARSLKVVNEALTSLDLAFNEIRVFLNFTKFIVVKAPALMDVLLFGCVQDDGAFAIAQALKANEDVTVTSLNLSCNFLTKFGQVTFPLSLNIY